MQFDYSCASYEYPFLQEGDYEIRIDYDRSNARGGDIFQVSSQTLVDQQNHQGVILASQEVNDKAL